MRVLVIENYPNTTLGLVGQALAEAGAECEIARMHDCAQLPRDYDGFDGVILLGGAQSALDDAEHPYLPHEAALAKATGDAGKPVLGICLGAQLLARGYGAENILGRPVEFGWREVRLTEAGRTDPVLSVLNRGAPLFHWHADTFTLPPGAVRLAESDMTAIQAFRIGRNVYGIQFHFEAWTGMVDSWNRDFAHEIAPIDAGWFERYPREAAKHGAAADAAGLALARAWVALLR
jgi:GMP synthase-like glutamine amidotransferase